jgi:hypothetical protein
MMPHEGLIKQRLLQKLETSKQKEMRETQKLSTLKLFTCTEA